MADVTPKKTVEILHPQIADTTENWAQRTVLIPKDHLAIDIDKRILKIGDGTSTFSSLRNHAHDEQYSPLTHGHYFGYGDKWFRTKPSLWLRTDIPNHPELVELNGQYLDDDRATKLVDLYVGETRISPVATEMSSEHYAITASSTSPFGLPYKAFGDSITMNNFLNALDQWTTDHIDVEDDDWIAMERKGSTLYTVSAYLMVARCGTPLAPFLPASSPRDWCVEISDDGVKWEKIDIVIDAPIWSPNEQRSYTIKGPIKDTRLLRIRITKWHAPSEANGVKEHGLRRIAFYGRRAGGFALPNLPSVHPEFAWVIPVDDIGVGMKHEEIGDIGETGNQLPLMPKNRVIANGQALPISEYDQLYGCYGQKYAPAVTQYPAYTTNKGTVDVMDGILVVNIPTGTDLTTDTVLTFAPSETTHPGTVTISFSNPSCIGTTWTLAGRTLENIWDTLHTQTTDNTEQVTKIPLHAAGAYKKFRLTVHTWSSAVGNTTVAFNMTGSKKDHFHVPNLVDVNDTTPYVVTQVRTEDINSSVVLDLQHVIGELQKQLTTTIKRLSDAEAEIQQMKLG